MEQKPLVEVGYIAGAHGLKGEVTIRLHDPDGDSVRKGAQLHLSAPGRPERILRVASVRDSAKGLLASLEGIEDRTSAETLKGSSILMERDDLPPLDEGEFYYRDVIGLPARLQDGTSLGTVTDVFHGATDILVVQGDTGEILVPVVEGFVESLGPDVVIVNPAALEFA
jgi:16S rRNA processing protein RimM